MSDDTEGESGVVGALREHLPVLARVAMALVGDAARIEAILEDVAREVGRTVDPPRAMKPWLFGLVRAACAKHLSSLPLKTRRFDAAAPATPEAEARAQLAALKPTEREAVVLCIVGSLDADELAAACNVEVAVAKERLSRGLIQMMTKEGSSR